MIGHSSNRCVERQRRVLDSPAEARRLLAMQRELVGRYRFLTNNPTTNAGDEIAAHGSDSSPEFFMPAAPNAETETSDTGASPYDRIEALIPADSPLHQICSMEELGDWLASNVLVPIDATRLNPVLGAGNPEADVMVIGEAPGAEEDRLGQAFVGRAGKLLDDILAAIKLSREENVYIGNILKSRPPNNRDPLPEEVAAHIPMLFKQIALIRPKLLLAVGKQAGNGLLQTSASLSSLRGEFHDFHGLPLLITYHPAALLRNPQWKRPTWEDVQLFRARYDQLMSG